MATPEKKAPSKRFARCFLLIGAILAFGYTVIVPPFQVPDEDRHLWRAYGISDFHFRGQKLTTIPESFEVLHSRFHPKYESDPRSKPVHHGELVSWLRQPLRPNYTVGVGNERANLYSFVPYLVSSAALRVGRSAEYSPLMLVYFGRIANAAAYLWLFYVAISILPDFCLLLLTIGLSPMSLHLAASFSADCLTLGLTAVLMACLFRLAFNQAVAKLRSRDVLLVIGLVSLLGLCKFNVWTALLVAMIPSGKFSSRRAQILFVGCCLTASVLTAFGWQIVNRPAIAAFHKLYFNEGRSLFENRTFILNHPFRFGGMIAFTCAVCSWVWLKEFIGVFGWLTIQMSPLHTLLYTATLVASVYSQSALVRVARFQRILLAMFVLLTVVSIHLLMWVFETPLAVLRNASHSWVFVQGIQGRYFLPVAFPSFVLLVSKRVTRSDGLLTVAVVSVVVSINVLALIGISLVYS